MLYVFVGNDVVVVRKEAHDFLQGQVGEAVRVTSENYSHGIVAEYLTAQSLFGEVQGPIVMDFLSEYDGALEACDDVLPDIVSSERLFVIVDTKPKVAREKLWRSHATRYVAVEDRDGKETFNTFALADALARKDKKSLWVLLVRAKMAGVAPEEIAGVLFWQLKSLRLAEMTNSPEQAGMKEYPYKKAKGALKAFAPRELESLTESLLRLYHHGHADSDMELGLERFALTL